MTTSFWHIPAAGARFVLARFVQAGLGLILGATLGHASPLLYTFSETGANPYSFSFLEMKPLTTTGAFAIPPFQVDGLTFDQATLTQAAGTGCFQFGTAGASLTATPFSCGLSAFAPEGGWQSLFLGATGPGTYTAFNAASDGSAPPAPDKLTIQNVSAFEYTFSNNGANPYSFSFLERSLLDTTGAFAIAPFQVDGLTFNQATLTQADGTGCFQFGTAGASLTAHAIFLRFECFRARGRMAEPFPRRNQARDVRRLQRCFGRKCASRSRRVSYRLATGAIESLAVHQQSGDSGSIGSGPAEAVLTEAVRELSAPPSLSRPLHPDEWKLLERGGTVICRSEERCVRRRRERLHASIRARWGGTPESRDSGERIPHRAILLSNAQRWRQFSTQPFSTSPFFSHSPWMTQWSSTTSSTVSSARCSLSRHWQTWRKPKSSRYKPGRKEGREPSRNMHHMLLMWFP